MHRSVVVSGRHSEVLAKVHDINHGVDLSSVCQLYGNIFLEVVRGISLVAVEEVFIGSLYFPNRHGNFRAGLLCNRCEGTLRLTFEL